MTDEIAQVPTRKSLPLHFWLLLVSAFMICVGLALLIIKQQWFKFDPYAHSDTELTLELQAPTDPYEWMATSAFWIWGIALVVAAISAYLRSRSRSDW